MTSGVYTDRELHKDRNWFYIEHLLAAPVQPFDPFKILAKVNRYLFGGSLKAPS